MSFLMKMIIGKKLNNVEMKFTRPIYLYSLSQFILQHSLPPLNPQFKPSDSISVSISSPEFWLLQLNML